MDQITQIKTLTEAAITAADTATEAANAEREAERAVLTRVLEIVRPAVARAGVRPRTSRRFGGGRNGLSPHDTSERYSCRLLRPRRRPAPAGRMVEHMSKTTTPEATTPRYPPQDVDDVTRAFPANIMHLLPPYDEIPEEFKNWNRPTRWNELVSRWFFNGLQGVRWDVKAGIDARAAIQHLRTIMRSFEPSHEHKEAAVAYLMSLWFDRVTVCGDTYE